MIDKYNKIYEEIKGLSPDETLQLVLNARTEEEQEFWMVVGDYLLQVKQREVIDENLF